MSTGADLRVAVIGGGAAGFFAAINAKVSFPTAQVDLYEKTSKILSKVRISGGGRCNVTNGAQSIKELSSAYPRGGQFMKKALKVFSTGDTVNWFESRGVPLKVEGDGRVFPVSNNSESIITCLVNEVKQLNIDIKLNCEVKKIETTNDTLTLHTKSEVIIYDKVIVATGGSPKKRGLEWLAALGHDIIEPVPSLFTFNMPAEEIVKLMGVVVETVSVSIQGSKLKSSGPLLITHWGMSGPAVLRLSAFGARFLSEKNYNFKIQVNWTNIQNHHQVQDQLRDTINLNPKKLLTNIKLFDLPERLWTHLLAKIGLDAKKTWQELGKKGINKVVDILTHDIYEVKGKTTFKEEFVTCGGVDISCINPLTMESRVVPNLYFAGEVMDIDGITGGYNFQAAWTTGFIAGRLS